MFAENGNTPWFLAPYFAVMLPLVTLLYDWLAPWAAVKSAGHYAVSGLGIGVMMFIPMYLAHKGWLRGMFVDHKRWNGAKHQAKRVDGKAETETDS